MRPLETLLTATPLLLACASALERKPPVQHVDVPICAKLSSGEAVDPLSWSDALGNTVGTVRDVCAKLMNDPEFCPIATSVGLSRTASLHPGLLPPDLAREAKDRCLEALGPKGKGDRCTPKGGFGLRITQ